MPRNLLFVAALIAGISYYFHDALALPELPDAAWKASACALLAGWVALGGRSGERWLLVLAFAVYALADALLDLSGMTVGAAAFSAGHLIMILIYLRHRRRPLSSEDWMIVGLLLVAVPLASFLIPDKRPDAIKVAAYAAVLGAMAAAALASEFRRDRVLLGVLLFVASDLLIFSMLGALRGSHLPGDFIWPLYLAGQALVAAGVSQELEARGR